MAQQRRLFNNINNGGAQGQNPDEAAHWDEINQLGPAIFGMQPEPGFGSDQPQSDWQLPDPYEGRAGYTPRESFGESTPAMPPSLGDVSLRSPAPGVGSPTDGSGMGMTTPREASAENAPPRSTPAQPRTPEPRAAMGVMPFKPMPQTGGSPMATSRLRGLYGSLGGLKGGGLGVPLDSSPNAANQPLDVLLKSLFKGSR